VPSTGRRDPTSSTMCAMRKLSLLFLALAVGACKGDDSRSVEAKSPDNLFVRGVIGAVEVEYGCPFAFRSLRHNAEGIQVFLDRKDGGCKDAVTSWNQVAPGPILVRVFESGVEEPIWGGQVQVR
jgi:hypothetical protein